MQIAIFEISSIVLFGNTKVFVIGKFNYFACFGPRCWAKASTVVFHLSNSLTKTHQSDQNWSKFRAIS